MSNIPDLNNFVHRLPGGHLREISEENGTMDIVLQDRCDPRDRPNYSEKRLGQTDAQFFAEIDRQIVARTAFSIDETRADMARLGVLKGEWMDAFRAWAQVKTKRSRRTSFQAPTGEPPPDDELIACNNDLMEKYRGVYEALVQLGYTHDELTL